jgi:glycosyltransferase involved in cell wall biosynthesis
MKLVIVTNILTPYRVPLFTAMARRVEHLTVLLMAEREENRQWEIGSVPFAVRVLPGVHFKPAGADISIHLNRGVISALRELNPDAILSGGFAAANVAAFLYAKLFGKKYFAWTHLTLRDGAQSSLLRRWVRYLVIGSADGSIAESTVAREAFIHYGAPSNRVLRAVMPLDVATIHSRTLAARQHDGYRRRRERFSGTVLLSIGQLIVRKGYRELLEIYERVQRARPDVSLVILGDGPERSVLERLVQDRGLRRVFFEGYVQAEGLPLYLACADIFLFHTLYDAFGLVLSEAMAAELPVVSSVHAAATRDLVSEGITGYAIDPRHADESAATLLKVIEMPEEARVAMGKAAYQQVLSCDAEPSAERIVAFMQRILTAPEGTGLEESWEAPS